MSHLGDSNGGGGGFSSATTPSIENYMHGSDWRGKWRQGGGGGVHIEPMKTAERQSAFSYQDGGSSMDHAPTERPGSGGPVIVDWRKTAASGTTPPKRARPWSSSAAEPQWHSNHAKGHHNHHHQVPWGDDWQEQQQQHSGWQEGGGEEWQGDRHWEGRGGRWWNWEAEHGDGPWQPEAWNDGHKSWDDGRGPWQEPGHQEGSTDQGDEPIPSGDDKTQQDVDQQGEPSTKKARSASMNSDGQQPGSTIFVNALRKLFQAKNAAAAAKAPTKTSPQSSPTVREKVQEKPLGGGALTALLAKQAVGPIAKAAATPTIPSPGSPSNGQSDTELRKNVLTRLLSSENAGELLQDPKVVEMLLQVASQLNENGLADLQKSVVKIITKLQSASSTAPPPPDAAAATSSSTLSPDQLAKRDACVERLKAILEGLRGLFLKRQEERISKASASAAAAVVAATATKPGGLTSTTSSHSALASLLSGVSAQNEPIYDHKVWTGYVQRSGVNKAKVNLFATLPVNSLLTALVAQLGNELNLKLRVPDTEVLHQRQNHTESSALLLMKADSAADQAELNAQIAYFNGRNRSGVAKLERDGDHYAAFMIPPGPLAEKLIGTDNYKRCNPDDMATVCMITKSDTNASAVAPH
ncbi:hypothetical protein Pmar_PMAR010069 [Perkinsus marinus ATCC 50983]|uniref:Spen paralogue and orthologue SPOC C-terminal domain-containing protein n=1 Tax=Perkinsus marinus (strain ATCC 50983 / TXsc) TaxID=423536 RepID=C5K4R2_PERM5|nr:hypothetical protein Pmar_PMAR010069 [Perkinsus marinus ATCC 50983]EER20334.1 hypothetical protein Pmar_PMAR010069 [Perkinsus marinus ATCC 50983]|eukprot:XP_002788538.1 hypothetical protein Pmar_PMAR010069 [Perkinsus marinus ATCC 50983]